jgi:hypothetical protein
MAEDPRLSKRIAQNLSYGINSVINAPANAWNGMVSVASGPNPLAVPALRSGEIYYTEADRKAAKQAEADQIAAERLKLLDVSPQMSMTSSPEYSSSTAAPSFEQFLASSPQAGSAQAPITPDMQVGATSQPSGQPSGQPGMPAAQKPLSEIEQLAQAYQEQQGLQSQAIKQAEEQLSAARNKPQQLDISPLIALSQSWSQSPNALLSAYQRPDDQAKTVQALQEAVLKARGGASELARMGYKDVAQLKQQQEQMRSNEELKRLQIDAMKQQKEGKGDLQERKFQFDVEEKYNKSVGQPIKKLGTFVSKVKDLKDYLSSKGEIPYNDPKYKGLVSQIVTQYNQDVAGLGALAGSDLKLLMNAVGQESTGVTGSVDTYFRNKFGGGVGSAIDSLSRLETQADETVKNETESLKSASTYPYLEKLHSENLSLYGKSRGLGGQAQAQSGSGYSKEDLDAEIKRRGLGGK